MNILLVDFDLYKTVGGGQTVYKRLIETNPNVRFYYFGRDETATSTRPANATVVPWKEEYSATKLTGEFSSLGLSMWNYVDYFWAANIAAAVRHLKLDVVDVPDYRFFGYLLAPALRAHGQKDCRVVLAMHGNLSETQLVNWGTPEQWVDVTADQREQWQYRVADVRYGLSRDYIEHWQKLGSFAAEYINPLRFVARSEPVAWHRRSAGVSLNFIGRTEGFKGPDLFLELLGWLPAGSYRVARMIGPSVFDQRGVSSTDLLKQMAALRTLEVEILPPMNRGELNRVYAERAITVLPSRMDTFNLVALESLLCGCPTAISRKMGVCRFLRDTLPTIPFVELDVDRLYASAAAIRDLIDRYDEERDRLTVAVSACTPVIDGKSLPEIYSASPRSESYLRRESERIYAELERFYARHRTPGYSRLVTAGVQVNDALTQRGAEPRRRASGKDNDHWADYRELFYMLEYTPAQIDTKVAFASSLSAAYRIDRGRAWAELARLERKRGNDFIAATYDIRVMRALGEDRLGRLPLAEATLRTKGFAREADALVAMYGCTGAREERCRALLAAAQERTRTVPDRSFEFIEDHRSTKTPTVSVIVSLYGAANKLETFLRMLAELSWVRDHRVELVLVDSHSPTNERQIYQSLRHLGLSVVYARTEQRETIQTAWNRGIQLARAPYLSFLGVDEMVRPDCFPLLAAELDRNPELDWVQGNALITEVDKHGTHLRDVMLYQRIPYDQDLVYLETCYLSWVGGLYRKNIHERFGYYDESFGAAGDTEFKGRVLPFIKSKTLPQTLGIFLNYPEERTTQSPRAEIEDLRAWYLHRTSAGVDYAMQGRPASDLRNLLAAALGYRKSYQANLSTDFDYACAIVEYARARGLELVPAACAEALLSMRALQRELDWLSELSPRAPGRARANALQKAAQMADVVKTVLRLPQGLPWQVFNDNRYEQHFFIWPGKEMVNTYQYGARTCWKPDANGLVVEPAGESLADLASQMRENGEVRDRITSHLREATQRAQSIGDLERTRDLSAVTQYLQAVGSMETAPVPDGSGAGALLCRILADCQAGRPLPAASVFDQRFNALARDLAQIIGDSCPELRDGLAGLAEYSAAHVEATRAMEVAARLLTYKDATDGIRRHRADITAKVVETLQRAADLAKASGNVAYSTRLATVMAAVKSEMANKTAAQLASAA